jgi:hypothetical protein
VGVPVSRLKQVGEAYATSKFKDEVKRTKFNNVKVEIDGIRFDSKFEAHRYTELKLMEKAGMIRDLKLQVRFPIIINEEKVCTYIADFVYQEEIEWAAGRSWQQVVEDAKGMRTPVYNLKKRLMRAVLGITIKETRVTR